MNNKVSIQFDNVSKKYKKGRKLLLKEALLDLFKSESSDSFWAIDDVSFKVKRGETLGIIGPNGSGKSTILKLIAKVTSPTKGKVEVKGRVAPLIELGAGFHPELSGRENIYLNGTILGLSRKEIQKKYKDIVSFSELEEFIDTPIKHYSSGMYMRLGFSVAVHIEPEILLVDEILAVGDEGFRKKCMRKMDSFKLKKISIVFISHNLNSVKEFCDRAIYIDNGKVVSSGEPSEMIGNYLKKGK